MENRKLAKWGFGVIVGAILTLGCLAVMATVPDWPWKLVAINSSLIVAAAIYFKPIN